MKSKVLRDAFGYIDDKYLDAVDNASESPKRGSAAKLSRLIKYGAAAAAVCLVCAGAVLLLNSPYIQRLSSDNTITRPDGSPSDSVTMTSERYRTLDDLLAVMSTSDSHDEKNSDAEGRSYGISADGFTEAESSAVFAGYLYRADPDTGTIGIYRQSSESEEPVGTIDLAAQHVFLRDDRLILVGSYMSGGTEFDYEMSTEARIYSLADPANPQFLDSYVQLGSFTACYMAEDSLYLLTSDGECACGWSRLDDKSEYMPELKKSGISVAWTDDEISILGEPTSVHYTAVSIIDTASSEIIRKRAFYGDIDTLYYGADWLAFNVFTASSTVRTHPELYTFSTSGSFVYTGKLSTAAMLEIPASALIVGSMPDGLYPEIKSVAKTDGIYLIIGELTVLSGGQAAHSLMAISADMTSGEYRYERLSLSEYSNVGIDEILWEDSRVIVSFSMILQQSGDFSQENRLAFAEFSGEDIIWYTSALTLDHVAGIDGMYYYGNPLGILKSLIPLGNGIYLRYNETPSGLDIYDLSDSAAPVCIYRSAGNIPEGCRFDFENYVYDESTVGIVMITPDANGEYRDVSFTWRVYRVDLTADQPLTLISEAPWAEGFDPLTAER